MNIKRINFAIKTLSIIAITMAIVLVILLNFYIQSNSSSNKNTNKDTLEQAQYAMACPSSAIPPYPEEIPQPFYEEEYENNFIRTSEKSVSTFGADVDIGSYAIMRNSINYGYLPSEDHIRTEEFLNYFDYHYQQHFESDFKVYTECGPSYFGESYHMLKIGIRARSISEEEREPTTLIFVIDVSGSMGDNNKLALIKETLPYLVDHLNDNDRIGIVIYSSTAQRILDPLGLIEKDKILNTINQLKIRSSTNVEDGLKKGYEMALEHQINGQITRLILLSDGCANTGISSVDGLIKMVQKYRDDGIFLSTYGFGMGVYNDELMEQLADNGDGKYGYIDSLKEAKREFIRELTGNLQTIAKDLKIQVEFDPNFVEIYRLLGYYNRLMDNEDFHNYSKDSGDIGAGHTVTALYELKFHPKAIKNNFVNIAIRYKEPKSSNPVELNFGLESKSIKDCISQTSPDYRFALCVAEFAEILSSSENSNSEISDIIPLADKAVDEFIYKYPEELEFLDIIDKADKLSEFKK